MSKAVMHSVSPQQCERIAAGEQTILLSKTRPNLETPFKDYMYCTKHKYHHLYDLRKISNGTLNLSVVEHNKTSLVADGFLNGKVIGEFICDRVRQQMVCHKELSHIKIRGYMERLSALCTAAALSIDDLHNYIDKDGQDFDIIYGWHISDLVIYDKPREVEEFWAYNEEWHKRFDEQDGYCCYDATTDSGEALVDCAGYEGVYNCYRCWEEWSGWCHRLTRPPQSWMYIEEV